MEGEHKMGEEEEGRRVEETGFKNQDDRYFQFSVEFPNVNFRKKK